MIEFAVPDIPVSESGEALVYDFNGDGSIDDVNSGKYPFLLSFPRKRESMFFSQIPASAGYTAYSFLTSHFSLLSHSR